MSAARLVLTACLLSLGAGTGTTAGAQTPPDAERLSRIESSIDSGRVESARNDLHLWFASREMAARRDDVVRARFLRARLSQNADSARSEYLWVAIDGRSKYGAEAWLRLAQLSLTQGNPGRAGQDLDRLRADYPGSELISTSWYWSGLARQAAGDLAGACKAWESALRMVSASGADHVAERTREAMTACTSGGLRLTVQIGAFSARSTAESVQARARAAGFEARIKRDGGLYKVQVGTFGTAEAARTMVRRLEAGGFTAVILAGEDS